MAADPGAQRDSRSDDEQDETAGDGRVDSDDTTQADAGMAGGTGAAEGEATATPQGTEPYEEEADTD